jgi:hypothetical protein
VVSIDVIFHSDFFLSLKGLQISFMLTFFVVMFFF